MLNVSEEESKFCGMPLSKTWACEREKTQFESCVTDFTEKPWPTLEVKEADQLLLFNNLLEKKLSCVVGRDASRDDGAYSSAMANQALHPLGKCGVEVNVTATAEREETSISHDVAFTLGLSEGVLKFSE